MVVGSGFDDLNTAKQLSRNFVVQNNMQMTVMNKLTTRAEGTGPDGAKLRSPQGLQLFP